MMMMGMRAAGLLVCSLLLAVAAAVVTATTAGPGAGLGVVVEAFQPPLAPAPSVVAATRCVD